MTADHVLGCVFLAIYTAAVTLNVSCSEGILRHIADETNTEKAAQDEQDEKKDGVIAMLALGVAIPLLLFISTKTRWGQKRFIKTEETRLKVISLAIVACFINIGPPIFYYRDYDVDLQKKSEA